MTKRRATVVFLLLFLAINTLKVSIFDAILTHATVSTFQNLLLSGIWIKFFAVSVVFILVLRLKWPFLFIALYFLQALYMFANLSYHVASEGYLHITQYAGLFAEAFELIKHGAAPAHSSWIFIALDVPLFAAVVALYPLATDFIKRFVFKKTIVAFVALLAFFMFKWQSVEAAQRPIAILNDKYSCDNTLVHKYGLLIFNAVDLLHLHDSKSRINRLNYGREISASGAGSVHPNIIMIQVESMDARIIATKHNSGWVTPFLHRLSQQCVFYPYTLSFHKAGSTSDCEFSVINSVEPFDDYPAMKLRNYEYPNSLLRPLTAAGYETAAFHGNLGSYFNRTIALKKMGFGSFYDITAMGLTEKGWGASDGDVFDFVGEMIRKRSTPFFYYIITMSSHEPFASVNSYYRNDGFDDMHDKTLSDYFRSMAYVDRELEKFIGQVTAIHPNTYFFIYGDHTPPLEPSAAYGKAACTENGAPIEFVPLFIVTPGGIVYNEQSRVAVFFDFAPTILSASNIPFTIRSPGKNLLAFTDEPSVIPYEEATYRRRELFQRICMQK